MYRKTMIIGALLLAQQSVAASLEVSPTTVSFSGGKTDATEKVESVWLTNSGQTPVRGQVRIYKWDQTDNRDVLQDTRAVVVSPPFLDIPAGDKQLVRLIRAEDSHSGTEQAYRLLIDEVPSQNETHTRDGVKFQLRYSVPVFIPAKGNVQGAADVLTGVQFSVKKEGRDTLFMVKNIQGSSHIKLARLSWVTPEGKRHLLYDGLMGYVLAGKQNAWPVSGTGSRGYFEAVVNDSKSPQKLLTLEG